MVFHQAYQAADDLGIELRLDRLEPQPTANILHAKMASKMVSLCQDGVNGLFVSIPSDKVVAAIKECENLNVPVISANSGAKKAKQLGLAHHISQLEYQAGYSAGKRLIESGMRESLCLNVEAGNVGTQERCEGFQDAVTESPQNVTSLGTVIMQRDFDTLNLKAVQDFMGRNDADWPGVGILSTGSSAAIISVELKKLHPALLAASFDLSETIYNGLDDGIFLFAIDQNPFVQGYIPVWMLTMMATSKQTLRNTFIESGPRFVTESPSKDLKICDENSFDVCARPLTIVLNDNFTESGILSFAYLAVGVSWACSLFFLYWLFSHRKLNFVKASQPEFLILMCLGGIISSSTLIALSFEAGKNDDDTKATIGCTAAPFLYTIGWSLMFSSICAKTFRMYKIMTNCNRDKQEVVSFISMIKIVLAVLAIDLAIVVAWTVINPLVVSQSSFFLLVRI